MSMKSVAVILDRRVYRFITPRIGNSVFKVSNSWFSSSLLRSRGIALGSMQRPFFPNALLKRMRRISAFFITRRLGHSFSDANKRERDRAEREKTLIHRDDAEKAVHAAIAGNGLLTLGKFTTFLITGSGAMLSEAIHSLADLANQLLLAIGIRQSKKSPDNEHPYGYHREQFVWALMSAMGIFCIGSGVTIYHGITTILEPEIIDSLPLAFAMLGASFLVEGATLGMAYRAVKRGAADQNMSIMEYLRTSADPMAVAVLLEDGAAVVGVLIAAGSLGLTALTGNPIWDGIGSTTIGFLLGGVAVFLIRRNRRFLVGANIPMKEYRKITSVLAKDAIVEKVHDVKAEMMGSDAVRFKAEIEFDGAEIARRHLLATGMDSAWSTVQSMEDKEELQRFLIQYGSDLIALLGAEVDRLEAKIRKSVPMASHIDLEAHISEGFRPTLLSHSLSLSEVSKIAQKVREETANTLKETKTRTSGHLELSEKT